jgi:hypothetical protein
MEPLFTFFNELLTSLLVDPRGVAGGDLAPAGGLVTGLAVELSPWGPIGELGPDSQPPK